MQCSILFTTQEQSWALSLEEIRGIPGCRFDKWLMPGVGIMVLPGDFHEASTVVRAAFPVFLRHIFPVMDTLAVSGEDFVAGSLTKAARALFETAGQDPVFSVQVRILDDNNYAFTKYEVIQQLSEALQEQGGRLSVQSPELVLSLLIYRGRAYMGLSKAEDNLSGWAGGMRRYARYEGQISRAEFKLMEALEVFDLKLPAGGRALDLGAAPGGWTSVLQGAGMRVVAVDPGDLAGPIRNTGLHHFQGLAQEYIALVSGQAPATQERFDLIVNDMRADIPDSARIMIDASSLLVPGGSMLMTFKLYRTHKRVRTVIQNGLSMLSQKYNITHVKQLFHNRSEVTVAGVRK